MVSDPTNICENLLILGTNRLNSCSKRAAQKSQVLVCSERVGWSASGAVVLPTREGSRELCWKLHGAQFFKMSSLEQRLSRIEEKLKQENEEARRRIDLNIDMSPQRSRPRPSECPPGGTALSVAARIAELKPSLAGGGGKKQADGNRGVGVFCGA